MPLGLFADRNFSVSNLAITTVSFAFTAMGFPLMLWAPAGAGVLPDPGRPAARADGDHVGPRGPGRRAADRPGAPARADLGGFAGLGVALALLAVTLAPDTPLWQLVLVFALMGLGSSFLWGPLATTANRNLPPQRAGAGSGVYNATRQVGAVLGSAAIAVLIDARLAANGLTFSPTEAGASRTLPAEVAGPFTDAMAQALLLLPAVLVLGLVASLFFERPRHFAARPGDAATAPQVAEAPAAGA